MRGEVPTIRPVVPTPRGDAERLAQSVEYYIACPVRSRCRSGLRAGSELAEGDNDAAQSGTIGSGQETWMQTTVVGPGNISFRYKMSSVSGDGLAFHVDEGVVASWSQGSTWPWTGNFAVPSGTHTLKWKYYKYSGSTAGSCWIDAIQWSGGAPGSGGGADWEQITYTYDPSGRRIAKLVSPPGGGDVDGVVTKYGAACPELAERDGDQAIGGPRPTLHHANRHSSIRNHQSQAVYEYDVYGQVAASDPNHPNRFLFTGREFDAETGLYYYRARYYNPTIGRFLQTDPIGYAGGMNGYAYCGNNAINCSDPSGCLYFTMSTVPDPETGAGIYIRFTVRNDDGSIAQYQDKDGNWLDAIYDACGVGDGCRWLRGLDDIFTDSWLQKQDGWLLAGDELTFWYLQAINKLGGGFDLKALEQAGYHIVRQSVAVASDEMYLDPATKMIKWSATGLELPWWRAAEPWETMRDGPVTYLAHELQHAADELAGANLWADQAVPGTDSFWSQMNAIRTENIVAMSLIGLAPKAYRIGEWRIPRILRWKPEHYLRGGGWPIDEPLPSPPWQ